MRNRSQKEVLPERVGERRNIRIGFLAERMMAVGLQLRGLMFDTAEQDVKAGNMLGLALGNGHHSLAVNNLVTAHCTLDWIPMGEGQSIVGLGSSVKLLDKQEVEHMVHYDVQNTGLQTVGFHNKDLDFPDIHADWRAALMQKQALADTHHNRSFAVAWRQGMEHWRLEQQHNMKA